MNARAVAVQQEDTELQAVEKVIRLLTLIEGTADTLSCLDSYEAIDTRRMAIRDAARDAALELESEFGLHWIPDPKGPTRRDGTPIPRGRDVRKHEGAIKAVR